MIFFINFNIFLFFKGMYKKLNVFPNAIRTLEMAVRLDNKNSATYRKLGWMRLKMIFWKRELIIYKKLIR